MKKNTRNNSEHVNYFNKLKSQQLLLEKHESCIVSFIKNNLDNNIEHEYNQMNDERNQEACRLQFENRDLYERLQEIKAMIKKENFCQNDLVDMRINLTTLQKNLNRFKNSIKTSMSSVKSAEDKLASDVEASQVIIDELNSHQNKRVIRSAPVTCPADAKCREVAEFVSFLNGSGGHEGGWASDDHLLFLKYYNRYRSLSKLVHCLRKLLPDKSEGEIIGHYDWYIKYSDMRTKQKHAIAEWKKTKVVIKKDEPKQQEEQTILKEKVCDDRKDIKEKIRKWKIERSEGKGVVGEEVERLAEKERKRKEMVRRKKLEVESWRNEKKMREERERVEREESERKEREFRVALANKMIREFQYLDWFYVRKRRETYLAGKLREFESKSGPIPKLRPREPDRLLQPTKQWLARTAPDVDPVRFNDQVKYINLVPKLAVPDWRKSIA